MSNFQWSINDFAHFRYEVGRYLPGYGDDPKTFKPYKEDKSKLVWMVIGRSDKEKCQPINIFEYNWIFLIELVWAAQNYPRSFKKFANHVRRWLAHEYAGRCQYEIQILADHAPRITREELKEYKKEMDRPDEYDKTKKRNYAYLKNDYLQIDIYDQIMLNWDRFINYCWDNKHLLTLKNLGLEDAADRYPNWRKPE